MRLRRLAGRGVECAEEDWVASRLGVDRVGMGGGELEGSMVATLEAGKAESASAFVRDVYEGYSRYYIGRYKLRSVGDARSFFPIQIPNSNLRD